MNQGEKIVQYLSNGREATSAELGLRFSIANVRAAIDAVRPSIQARGLDIYSNRKSTGKNKYRIGHKRALVGATRSLGTWFGYKTYYNLTESAGLTLSA
jgi:hypothetical protein